MTSTCSFRAKRRRGLTLFEAGATIAVASTIFGIAVELLSLTMHATGEARDRAMAAQSMARLADQFRDNVHAASEILAPDPAGKSSHWSIRTADGRRLEYEFAPGAVKWRKYNGATVVAREAFMLPDDFIPRLELEPGDKPTMASLIVERNGDGTPRPHLRIDAAIGRDCRLVEAIHTSKAGG